MKLFTLLYHDIVEAGKFDSSGFGGADANKYKLDRAEFERQLDLVATTGATIGSVSGEDTLPPQGSCLFTFDDGGASALSVTADLLETRGWRGHFFISTDFIGSSGFMTAVQLRALSQRGHVIGSHSCSHPRRISHCPPAQIVREWRDSVHLLEDILGAAVRTASVPGGFHSSRVAAAAAEAGIAVLFTSEPVATVGREAGCLTVGRFSIDRGTPAKTVAGIVGGESWPRFGQWVFWNVKKAVKKAGGEHWLRLRKAALEHAARH